MSHAVQHNRIIIAGTHREAEVYAQGLMHSLVTHQDVQVSHDRSICCYNVWDPETQRSERFRYVSANQPEALRGLQGLLLHEVVIAGDYSRWRTSPGALQDLWRSLEILRLHNGVKVVWW